MTFLSRFIRWFALASAALAPLAIAWYIRSDEERRVVAYGFHEAAIAVAVIAAAFIAFVAYSGYRRFTASFLGFAALAYGGFALVYAPHGFLTPLAHTQTGLFLAFGPSSRLIMNFYLLAALFALPVKQGQARVRFGLHAVVIAAVGLMIAFVPALTTLPARRAMEGVALLIALVAIGRLFFLRGRATLMGYHIASQICFAEASIVFLFSRPWNEMWWLAHAVSGAGFMILGYGLARRHEVSHSLESVYDVVVLREMFDRVLLLSDLGLALVDDAKRVIWANPTAYRLLSVEKEEELSQFINDSSAPSAKERITVGARTVEIRTAPVRVESERARPS